METKKCVECGKEKDEKRQDYDLCIDCALSHLPEESRFEELIAGGY
jgi:hypothetical protein